MSTLIVHPAYCSEHTDSHHYLDENGKCWGTSLIEVEKKGYTWPRHIGGGWFEFKPKYPSRYDLAWEMSQDAYQQTLALEAEADARSNNSFDHDVEF